MEFLPLEVGPLDTNCFLIWDQDTRKAAIIDPGGDKDRIIAEVAARGLVVEWILLTHGHFDHTFHAGDLAAEFGARVGMHEADLVHLTDGLELAAMLYDMSRHVDFAPSDMLADGQVITLGESKIEVAHTPGHSQGGLCFVTDVGVFCGDAIFSGSIGRTDFPGGSYEQLIHSIRTRILTLAPETPLYPGHGPATTVGVERDTNPFL